MLRADPGGRRRDRAAARGHRGRPGRGRAAAGPADAARRAGGPGARLLRGARPASTSATGTRSSRWRVILAAISVALAVAYLVADRRDVRQHVRRPDDALPGQPVDRGLARDRAGDPLRGRHHDRRRCMHTRRLRLGARSSCGRPPSDRLADELAASPLEPATEDRCRPGRRRGRGGPRRRAASDAPLRPGAGGRRPSVAARPRSRRPRPPTPGRGRAGAPRPPSPMPTWTRAAVVRRARHHRLVPRRGSARRRSAPTGAALARDGARRAARPARPVVPGRARRRPR